MEGRKGGKAKRREKYGKGVISESFS